MSHDLADWQFWVVTVIAAGALLYLVRGAIPERVWKRRKKGHAASLTIEGKSMSKKPRGGSR
ncbi:MAG: hypothetical protein GC200_00970 [Tepidisphaera sp.]|nr:hypothetical protein [Tepidisphaera sp.]